MVVSEVKMDLGKWRQSRVSVLNAKAHLKLRARREPDLVHVGANKIAIRVVWRLILSIDHLATLQTRPVRRSGVNEFGMAIR